MSNTVYLFQQKIKYKQCPCFSKQCTRNVLGEVHWVIVTPLVGLLSGSQNSC